MSVVSVVSVRVYACTRVRVYACTRVCACTRVRVYACAWVYTSRLEGFINACTIIK